MVEIFLWVCPPPALDAWKVVPSTPLYLGTICKQWREMAWSSAILWKDVAVQLAPTSAQVSLLRDWLLRAKTMPLSITVYGHDNANLTPENNTLHALDISMFKVLLTRSRFWSTFRCSGFLPEFINIFDNEQFPVLKSIQLEHRHPFPSLYSHYNTPPNALFAASPQLEHFLLKGYPFSEAVMPLTPLKSIAIFVLSVEDSMTVFRSYSILVSARLGSVGSNHFATVIPTSKSPAFKHSTLSTLHVSCWLDTEYLLGSLELPSLENLHVSARTTCLSSVVSLVERSRCLLHTLNLDIHYKEDDDLIAAFKSFPRLSSLRLAWFQAYSFSERSRVGARFLTEKLATMLIPAHGNGPPLLPNLTCLTWEDDIPEDCQLPLAEAIEQRWHIKAVGNAVTVARLNSVTFVEQFCNLHLKNVLSTLSQEGMNVKLMRYLV
ncbi:hypothetical protein CPC08DRAFT_768510 [Agrocybe pediades]|nr:hypothetical protein CPC08DRAFT_768510 [Agrocybe pediades]